MAIQISIERVKLVRETAHRYDIASRSIGKPEDALKIINEVLDIEHEPSEVLAEIMLNAKNEVNGIHQITTGSVMQSGCTPLEVYRAAILHNAPSIILFHNHPSGNPSPSREDVKFTERIVKAGQIIGIKVLDHIIVGNDGSYTSLRVEGFIE